MINEVEAHEQDDEAGEVLKVHKTLFIFGEINPMSVGHFMAAFKDADSKPGRINVYICSNGGWVEGGLVMHDIIRSSINQVFTFACGAVYSSAVLPFEAGDNRFIFPSSMLFFHDMSVSIPESHRKTITSVNKQTDFLYDLYCEYIADRAKIAPKQIDKLCMEETYLNSKECLDFNLVDTVIPFNDKKYIMPTAPKKAKKK
jgi:ATP-dependent protease ClpP protease subunit